LLNPFSQLLCKKIKGRIWLYATTYGQNMVILKNSLKYGEFSPFIKFKKSFVCDAETPPFFFVTKQWKFLKMNIDCEGC
jgi:hypothetical protein